MNPNQQNETDIMPDAQLAPRLPSHRPDDPLWQQLRLKDIPADKPWTAKDTPLLLLRSQSHAPGQAPLILATDRRNFWSVFVWADGAWRGRIAPVISTGLGFHLTTAKAILLSFGPDANLDPRAIETLKAWPNRFSDWLREIEESRPA